MMHNSRQPSDVPTVQKINITIAEMYSRYIGWCTVRRANDQHMPFYGLRDNAFLKSLFLERTQKRLMLGASIIKLWERCNLKTPWWNWRLDGLLDI
jgi:hypothetical protein